MKRLMFLFVFFVLLTSTVAIFWINFPIKHKDIIVKYSKHYDLDASLISAVINAESGFDRKAVSDMGACGLMQLLPTTAEEVAYKLKMSQFDLFEPDANIQLGCYYLRYLLDIYDDMVLALCAYNAGLNNVNAWDFDGRVENIPVPQTKAYVQKILKQQKIYKTFYF